LLIPYSLVNKDYQWVWVCLTELRTHTYTVAASLPQMKHGSLRSSTHCHLQLKPARHLHTKTFSWSQCARAASEIDIIFPYRRRYVASHRTPTAVERPFCIYGSIPLFFLRRSPAAVSVIHIADWRVCRSDTIRLGEDSVHDMTHFSERCTQTCIRFSGSMGYGTIWTSGPQSRVYRRQILAPPPFIRVHKKSKLTVFWYNTKKCSRISIKFST